MNPFTRRWTWTDMVLVAGCVATTFRHEAGKSWLAMWGIGALIAAGWMLGYLGFFWLCRQVVAMERDRAP